jgi:hypothetical protein
MPYSSKRIPIAASTSSSRGKRPSKRTPRRHTKVDFQAPRKAEKDDEERGSEL